MKKLMYQILLGCVMGSIIMYVACKKEAEKPKAKALSELAAICDGKATIASIKAGNQTSSTTGTVPYTVSLILKKSNGDGTYTWIWKIINPNPGNGKDNGTVQDLSHWGISLGLCAKKENIVSAAISTNGTTWTSFSPEYKEDKSQDCYSNPILKFDAGTSGSNATYYRLIVNKDFTAEKVDAVYKSGKNTGCGVFQICAFGCPANH